MSSITAPLPARSIAAPSAPRTGTSGWARLAAGALFAEALLLCWFMAFVFHHVIPPMAVLAVLCAVAGAFTLRGTRWAPALGSVLALLLAVLNLPHLVDELARPEGALFAASLLYLVFCLVALVAGIGAAIVARRTTVSTPRWLVAGVLTVAGFAGGAIATARVVQAAGVGSTGVSAEVLAALPGVVTHEFDFTSHEIRVKAGERVALRLENRDPVAHSFDIDAMGVHVAMPGRGTGIALFTAGKPGRYTFYCRPHYDAKSGQGMKGVLIVE